MFGHRALYQFASMSFQRDEMSALYRDCFAQGGPPLAPTHVSMLRGTCGRCRGRVAGRVVDMQRTCRRSVGASDRLDGAPLTTACHVSHPPMRSHPPQLLVRSHPVSCHASHTSSPSGVPIHS